MADFLYYSLQNITNVNIIIETPKGSSEKFKYDENFRLFRLEKTLPAGLVFPFDFGFIHGTKGADGEPLDVLLISEFKTFPGCIMDGRIVGCIEGDQTQGTTQFRSDRFLAVAEQSIVFENVISIEDLPSTLISEIESFFINYMRGEGKELKLMENLNAAQAMSLLGKMAGTTELLSTTA